MAEMKKTVGKSLVSITGLAVLFALVILVNVLATFASLRFDATEDKVFSLSDGSKKIVGELSEPVTFKVFYSASEKRLPLQIKTYARRVIEFLNEYRRVSHGMVTVDVIDPKPDSDQEEWAQKYGIEARTAGQGDRIYFGLVAICADQEDVIPFLDPSQENLLEYDLTRMIVTVTNPKKKMIGVISSLPVFGQSKGRPGMPAMEEPEGRWYFIEELMKTYDVTDLGANVESIPDTVDLLLVFYPKFLGPKAPYAIDQYVLSGKNAVIYLDPMCLSDPAAQSGQMRSLQSSALDKTMNGWGFSMVPGKAVADISQATRVRNRFGFVEENPMWISVRGDFLNPESVITADLDTFLLPVAGALQKDPKSPLNWEVLIQSSEDSDLLDAFTATLGARSIKQDFVSTGKQQPMAVKVSGKFTTAFPDGPPRMEEEGQDAPAPDLSGHLAKAEKPSTLVVVSDVDNLNDVYYLDKQNFMGYMMVRMYNDNLNFLLNTCELLSGNQNLIDIRSRGRFERPFTRVLDLRAKAEKKWLDKEKELMQKADETNKKLQELERVKSEDQQQIVSPEQKAELEKFKEQKRQIDKELRQVRFRLNEDIERLGMWLKIINIVLVPGIVILFGLGFGLYRYTKTRRR